MALLSSQSHDSKKEELKNQIRSEFALTNAQELINNMSEKCFAGCVPTPGSSLTSSESACISKCMKKYLESWNLISQIYTRRIQQESAKDH
ncbi:protein translocase subunit [Dimargaris verticillata]|uniref:Mitochondrial import inner membrane translocase subunit n=1 Tax=Dimargaris verticillata TaxID=2761393 RepID=A0A9W8B5R8_9FUNG|nr:protein translocase subunit [Dimargaris verticillata]KAJ1977663.1 protein translocase subunit [Dimargaris xerosporica]